MTSSTHVSVEPLRGSNPEAREQIHRERLLAWAAGESIRVIAQRYGVRREAIHLFAATLLGAVAVIGKDETPHPTIRKAAANRDAVGGSEAFPRNGWHDSGRGRREASGPKEKIRG